VPPSGGEMSTELSAPDALTPDGYLNRKPPPCIDNRISSDYQKGNGEHLPRYNEGGIHPRSPASLHHIPATGEE